MQHIRSWFQTKICMVGGQEAEKRQEVNCLCPKDEQALSYSMIETMATQASTNDHLLSFPSDRCNTENPLEQPDVEDSSYW